MRRWMILLAVLPVTLSAGEAPRFYDRVQLTASATGRIDNDMVSATLYAQEDGGFPAELADKVNQKVKWGVETARQKPGIKVQTQSYNTQPVYRDNRITGWRVSQSIVVESKDIAAVSELLGVLQSRLNLQGMSFSVSPEAREVRENQLIAEALAAFEKRAKLVAESLKRQNYKLVELHVGSEGQAPPPRFAARAMMAEAAAVAAPAMEAGESKLTVTINGTVELQ